jgi:phage terminase large subunit GpA-like protein
MESLLPVNKSTSTTTHCDERKLPVIDHDLMRSWLGMLAPPARIKPSDFAESQLMMPASSNAIPGPLRLAPYQRELVNCIADPDTDIIVMQLSAQTGKSTALDCMIGWMMKVSPGPALHVSPTESRSADYVRERLSPLIASSPALKAIAGKGQDTRKGSTGGSQSLASISYPAGQLSFASSFRSDTLASRSIKWLFADECDRFALSSSGGEGSPISLAIKRTKTFEGKGRKIILVSTPTNRGSRINEWYLKGDQRKFFCPCPDCGHYAPLAFENLKWTEGKPSTAHHVCEECGCIHNEAQRRAMLELGEWRPTAVGQPGVRSYHLNELSSKFSTLESVAAQYEAALTPEQRQSFFNTTLGQTYEAGVEVELSGSELVPVV